MALLFGDGQPGAAGWGSRPSGVCQEVDVRAIVVRAYGGPDVLQPEEWDGPVAGPGMVVVDVAAVGVNFADIYGRQGRAPYAGGALPYVPGSEVAGVVSAVGADVTEFQVGDRVAWSGYPGAYAEKAAVPAARLIAVPDGVELTTAAAVLLQGMTAQYLASTTYPVQPGDPVVVHAAAGGTGRLLVQIVKHRGGVVIATTSTPAKAEHARSAGADHVTDYDSFVALTKEITGGAGAAAVYDGVGQSTFDSSLMALRPRGMMVLFGASSGPVSMFDLTRLNAGGSLFITRPTLVHYTTTRAELLERAGDVFGRIAAGNLDVVIGATYPLADAAKAHTDVASRATTGKLLLIP
jgi:NADPH2:quinone reductase